MCFVGELIFGKAKCSDKEKIKDYKMITTYWPDHLSFLNSSLVAARHRKFRGWKRLEKFENDLVSLAEKLSEDHPWSDWIRFEDLKNIGVSDHETDNKAKNIFKASNFTEAAGMILLLREGINIKSICRPCHGINEMQ